MKPRSFIISLFSVIFALFILFYQYANKIIFIISKRFSILYNTQKHIKTIFNKLSSQGNMAVCEYIQIIANSSISLMSAYSILHFHQHFLQIIIIVSHHVHHWFIQFIADVPDYSGILQSSYYFKVVVCYLYLVFGYLGISSQIILTVDLIYISNLPTIIIYKLLAKIYQLLIKYFKILIDLITINQKYWISCPYNPILLRDSFKVIYIGLIPIFMYLILVVVFYYLWLTFVIAFLKIFMNISLNLGLIFDQLGFFLCLIKGIDLQPQKKEGVNKQMKGFFHKIDTFRMKLANLQWVPLLQYKIFIQILKGNDLFQEEENNGPLEAQIKLRKILNNFKQFSG